MGLHEKWELRYEVDDKATVVEVDVINFYWGAVGGKFHHTVKEVAKAASLKPHEVTKIAQKHSHAWYDEQRCPGCGEVTRSQWRCRSDVSSTLAFKCYKCNYVPKVPSPEIISEIEDAKPKPGTAPVSSLPPMSDKDLAILSYANNTYESLNPLEFNVLVEMAKLMRAPEGGQPASTARKRLGLGKNTFHHIYDKLFDLGLLYKVGDCWAMIDDLVNLALLVGDTRLVSRICSPNAWALYRILKTKEMFVFPETPLIAFVAPEVAEDVMTEHWQKKYFWTCRVDFVVCDQESYPIRAYEYDGGYHKDADMKAKDAFKDAVCAHVGLPLHRIQHKDLQAMQKVS